MVTKNFTNADRPIQEIGTIDADVYNLLDPMTFASNEFINGAGNTDTVNLADGTNLVRLRNIEQVNGGTGNDKAVFLGVLNGANVDLGGGSDTLFLANTTNVSGVVSNTEVIVGGSLNDSITLGANKAGDLVNLLGGNNSLTLTQATANLEVRNVQSLTGSGGNDVVRYGNALGGANVNMGGGNDILFLANTSNVGVVSNTETLVGGSQNDNITLGANKAGDLINLLGGSNTLTLTQAAANLEVRNVQALTGSAGNDVVRYGNALGGANVNLGGGNDLLYLANINNVSGVISNTETVVGGSADDNVTLGAMAPNSLVNLLGGSNTLTLTQAANVRVANVQTLNGSGGNDIVNYLNAAGAGTMIDLGNGTDALLLANVANTAMIAGTESVEGGSVGDTLTLTGSTSARVSGNAGADALTGGAGDDTLLGGTGGDILNGGLGADQLEGEDGNDRLVYDALDTVVEGGAGIDTLAVVTAGSLNVNLSAADQVTGGASTASGFENVDATGSTGNLSITGDAGQNNLTGGAGNDTIDAGGGVDNIDGGAGNDRVIYDSSDNVVDGGAGSGDVLVVGGATSVTIDLGSTVDQTPSDSTIALNFEQVDAATNTGGVRIIGNAADNFLTGGFGNDTLLGGAGMDTVVGGFGADELHGEDGDDRVVLSSSTTLATGGNGNDTVVLSGGGAVTNIDLTAGSTFPPGNQNATVDGKGNPIGTQLNGFENVDGSASGFNLSIKGSLSDNTLIGGLGADTIDGIDGNDTISGLGSNDLLSGGDGADSIDGGGGDDDIFGGVGQDMLLGGAGDDYIEGGGDNDSIDGQIGLDQLLGGDGRDTITGGSDAQSEADTIEGGAGADSLLGGGGNDLFVVGDDADFTTPDPLTGDREVVIGGPGGADELLFQDSDSGGTALDATKGDLDGVLGTEVLSFGGSDDDSVTFNDAFFDRNPDPFTIRETNPGGGTLFVDASLTDSGAIITESYSNGEADTLIGGDADDIFRFLNDSRGSDDLGTADEVRGNGGTNRIEVEESGDYVLGGLVTGIDEVRVIQDGLPPTQTNVSIDAAFDNDTVAPGPDMLLVDATLLTGLGDSVTGGEQLVFDGSANSNTLFTVEGGSGNDSIQGGSYAGTPGDGIGDTLRGHDGLDTIKGAGGDDLIDGGAANDSLSGEAGEDVLLGGLGDDTLSGGDDADVLSGQQGADDLRGGSGADTLLGGEDNDVLTGGADADSLDGGAGDDDFIVGVNSELIGLNETVDGGVSGFDRIVFNDNAGTTITGGETDDWFNLDELVFNGTGNDSVTFDAGFFNRDNGSSPFQITESSLNPQGTLNVNAAAVASGDGFTINTYSANEADSLVGSGVGDLFHFVRDTRAGNEMDTADTVTGGGGNDTIGIDEGGTYTFGAAVTGIENVEVNNNPLNIATSTTMLTLADAFTYAGVSSSIINIDASQLESLDDFVLNAAANLSTERLNVTSGDGNDSLTAGAGADTIFGGLGDDTITGGGGNDRLIGSDGDDLFLYNPGSDFVTGTETVDGGNGIDTMRFTDATAHNFVPGQLAGLSGIDVLDFDGASTDSVVLDDGFFASNGVSTFTIDTSGAPGALTLDASGVTGPNRVVVLGNTVGGVDDSLLGGGGDDDFRFSGATGLEGTDSIDGGSGSDDIILETGFGNVVATIGSGVTNLDRVLVEDGAVGNTVSITLDAGFGGSIEVDASQLDGAEGETLFFDGGASSASETVTGGTGNDTIIGGNGIDSVTAGDGDDFVGPSAGGNVDGGNDTILGGAGNDTIGGAVADTDLTPGINADSSLLQGNDSIVGGTGTDSIRGGFGADTIDLGNDGEADSVIYGHINDGGGAGDDVTGFDVGLDMFLFETQQTTSGFNTGGSQNLDDVTDDDSFAFDSNGVFDFGTEDEAALLGGFTNVADATEVANTFSGQMAASGGPTGADALLVATGGGQTGVWVYAESGFNENQIQSFELTLLATVDAVLTSSDFDFLS